MRTHALVALLLHAALLPAQQLRWQLPERGGAIYQRKLQVDSAVEPHGAHVPDPWLIGQQPGTLLHGELDADRLRRAGTPADWRELLPQLALDLGPVRAGKVRAAIATIWRYQPVRIEVDYSAIDANGEQSFTGTIEIDAKAARGEGAVPPEAAKFVGKLEGRRRIEATRGLVTWFEGRLDLIGDYPAWKEGDRQHPVRRRTLRITDEWREPQLVAPDDAAWNTRIADAIRASAAQLKTTLDERLKRPFAPGGDPYHDVQPGELALTLLALRRSGEDGREPVLAAGFDQLRKLVIEGTYSLAVAILAFESLYTPPGEWAELRAGRLRAPMARVLPPADLQLVRDWAKALLDNIDTTVDAAYLRRWHYGPSKEWDNSNMQYALLGLYGAQLCGVETSPTVWTAAANHWLQCAVTSGTAVTPDFQSHKEVEKAGRTRAGGQKLQPRGWGYHDADPTGSMTTAGITGLTVCSSALRLSKKGNAKLLADCDEAIRAGFVWFQHWLSVRHNPRPTHGDAAWHLYYLYGLERACELNQVARIAGRDWYTEGAIQLIATQRPDGSWGSPVDTAFGLLFLKKTALPAITGR
jgi:hypothetical protein